METLGFGSHVTIDGYQAKAERLADESHVREVLERLAGQLELGTHATVKSYHTGIGRSEGISAGIVLAESHIAVHTFPHRRSLSLDVFSRKNLNLPELLNELVTAFDVGRYESHVGNRSKNYPRQPEPLLRHLQGDRGYVDVRLDETLLTY